MIVGDEREDELAWFGVTVELSDEAVVTGSDSAVRVPTVVRLDGSGRSLTEKWELEVSVVPERGTTEAETRLRAIMEARELAKLFLRLTEADERRSDMS